MRGNPNLQFAGATVDQLVADYMREHQVAGMALAIVQAPYITRACGYGVADVERQLLVGTHTLFDIGQMVQAYAAVAVLQLVEAGKLSLEHLQTAGHHELVEQASGQTFAQFVRAHQIDPLGLKQTWFAGELDGLARETLAAGQKHSQFLHQNAYINPTEPAANGPVDGNALYASAMDISHWDIALAGDVLVQSADLRKLIYQPASARLGPWEFPGRPGLMVVTGSRSGFSSLLSRFTHPQDLLCVTLLANREGLDLSQLARQIAGAYDPRLGPPPQSAGMRVQQSPHSVEETVARLEASLSAAGISLLGRVDHSAGARSANLNLEPTTELIFGNPAAGTLLMQSNRAVAVDLPLRAVVYQQADEVWVVASDPMELARRHNLQDHSELLLKMRAGVDRVLLKTVSPY